VNIPYPCQARIAAAAAAISARLLAALAALALFAARVLNVAADRDTAHVLGFARALGFSRVLADALRRSRDWRIRSADTDAAVGVPYVEAGGLA
jgi:hypothetical protein